MEQPNYDSSNINTRWLENIYENLKNLEMYERMAREGCISILDYIQFPVENRSVFLCDIQYKNLRFIVNEMDLLMTDLTPVIDETKLEEFRTVLDKIGKKINNREVFVSDSYSSLRGKITDSKMTNVFHETLGFLMVLRQQVIKSIAHILYVKSEPIKRGFRQ